MNKRVSNLLVIGIVSTIATASLGQTAKDVLASQAQTSARLMLVNIAPPGAKPGAVVASPSKGSPNYFFTWTRDSALTMEQVLRLYTSTRSPIYMKLMMDYVAFSRKNQTTKTLGGLGEPKFNVDGSAFNLPWGRPQNDGPALRAITNIHFARTLISQGQGQFVRQNLYDSRLPSQSVVKVDLDYVAQHWGESTFDLWEEVRGRHFYSLMVERRALLEGAQLAQMLGDAGSAALYSQVASQITMVVKGFWNGTKQVLAPTLGRDAGVDYKTSDLDLAVILGVLHGSVSDGFLTPSNDMVLATAVKLEKAFKAMYQINQNPTLGTAIGRYPEDRYNGISTGTVGNPWFIGTLAYAELCYRVEAEFQNAGVLKVTELNKAFLDEALGASGLLQVGMILKPTDQRFAGVLKGITTMGDNFMKRVLFHRGAEGSLSEQMNRDTGYLQGAANLTWSHAAYLSAYNWRMGILRTQGL